MRRRIRPGQNRRLWFNWYGWRLYSVYQFGTLGDSSLPVQTLEFILMKHSLVKVRLSFGK